MYSYYWWNDQIKRAKQQIEAIIWIRVWKETGNIWSLMQFANKDCEWRKIKQRQINKRILRKHCKAQSITWRNKRIVTHIKVM